MSCTFKDLIQYKYINSDSAKINTCPQGYIVALYGIGGRVEPECELKLGLPNTSNN